MLACYLVVKMICCVGALLQKGNGKKEMLKSEVLVVDVALPPFFTFFTSMRI